MYQYPYGNAQQLNLDWLMEQWQEVKQSIDGSLQGEIDRVEAAITDLLAARDAAVAAAGAANTSANAAAASAQAAAGDAATATAQAAAANTARSNAAQAANNAQQYAGNAQTQAAAAQNAAGQAAASASQAAANAQAASGSAVNAAASAAGALQNFQLSDAARQAAQAAAQDAQDVLDSIPEDYTELSNDVNELKTTITQSKIEDIPAIEDKLNKVSGSNLYDPREKEIGIINQDGTVTYNENYITTGIIPVTPSYKIRTAYRVYMSMYDANISRVLLFDESMQIISLETSIGTYMYELPNNAYYVRVTVSSSVESTLMIVCDADPQRPTTYEPYANYFEATYAFVKTAIDPLIINSIAPVLENMVADTALVVNDFRIVNNTLYRITSPVASGGTLTPNTNCIATTITEILKTLLS